jgi:hypothetical protein
MVVLLIGVVRWVKECCLALMGYAKGESGQDVWKRSGRLRRMNSDRIAGHAIRE